VATTTWVREAMSNRLNDMDRSAIVVIMQRVHEDDVSGMIIADKLGYVHLCIPLEFEPDKRCVTYVKGKPFWADPRRVVDQCFWPERFTPGAMVAIKLMGEHAYAGQYQQRPEPRGGGLFKRDYWRRWEIVNNRFPTLHYIVASLDGAFTEKTANDPSGFTCWGVFTDHDNNQCAITLTAWRKHLPLHKNCRAKRKDESWAMYKAQTEQDWGLIQWLHYECNRWGKGVDKLLIEDKANGHDVANEMLRLFKYSKFIVQLVDPEGMDKWARAVRVQPVFAEGLIYTLDEKLGKKWVSELITELAMFPRGRFDDQVDSSTQALWFLRKNGFLVMADERRAALVQKEEHKRKLTALYPM
jgi:predicted phage terminase large subunit-like protein